MLHPNNLDFPYYHRLSENDCEQRIIAAKKQLGDDLIILAHHYQREEVYKHHDISGDSLGLAKQAAKSKARYVVFCGVHFMAEVANILTNSEQITILPDLAAGCSMADMANSTTVERAWQELGKIIDVENEVTPITYINSTAALKAFCARHGGIVCTSSNAEQVITWALKHRRRILFFPDQHLGRNTCYRLGIPLDQMATWDYQKSQGGLTANTIADSQIYLWQGYCSVHHKFKTEDIDFYLERYPDAKILAHPEACFEVCQRADYVGSTSYIIDTVKNSPPGTHWLVATELNLVNRLHRRYQHEGKIVKFMSPRVSMCSTMFRTDPQHLAWVLDNLVQGNIVNQITVPTEIATQAKIALERMFALF